MFSVEMIWLGAERNRQGRKMGKYLETNGLLVLVFLWDLLTVVKYSFSCLILQSLQLVSNPNYLENIKYLELNDQVKENKHIYYVFKL